MNSPAPPEKRRRRTGRFFLAAGAVVLLSILLVATAAYFGARAFLGSAGPARVAEAVIAAETGLETRIESLDLRPADGVAEARGIALGSGIAADRARVAFEPGALASGRMPRLLSVKIDGAAIVLSESTAAEFARLAERLARRGAGSGASGAAAERPDIRVTGGSVRIERDGKGFTVAPVSFRLDASGAARLEATGEGIDIVVETIENGNGGFRARAALGAGSPAALAATLLPNAEKGAIPKTIDAEITARRADAEINAWQIDADVRATFARHPLTGREPAEIAVALAARAAENGPVAIERLVVTGLFDAPVAASGSADPDAERLALHSESPVRFEVPGAGGGALVLEDWSAEARPGGAFRGGVRARGEGDFPALGPLGAAADGARFRLDAVFPGGGADATFVLDASARAPDEGDAASEPMGFVGRGRFALGGRSLFLDAGRFDWPRVASASVDGAIEFGAKRLARLRVDVSRDIDIEAVAAALRAARLLRPGLAVQGLVRGGAEIADWAFGERAPERASALLLGRDVAFTAAPKGRAPIAGEELRFSASLSAERDVPSGRVEGRLAGDFGNVQILAGDSLVDLEGRTIAFDVPFSIDAATREIRSEKTRLMAGDLGELAAAGSVLFRNDGAPVSGSLDLALRGVSLESAFERSLLADAKEHYPSLASTAITGALDATARLSFGADGGFALAGEATVDDAGAAGPFFDVEGASCRVPIALGAAAETGPRPGFVRVEAATVRGVRVEGLDLPLLFARNRILLLEPKSVAVFGGEVEVADLRYEAERGAAASFVMRGLDAALIGHALDSPLALAGAVETEGPLVMSLDASGIRFAGTIVARVLGGDVRLGGIAVDDPFGSVPRFRFDADAVDLDLEKLTAALAYGEMTGNFSAEARDVVVAPHGVDRFAARFAAHAAEGRPAKASVKAIREIPFLATEGRLTLQGILFDLINSFSYSRFGAIAALEGDVFHVRGRYAKDGSDLYGSIEALSLPFEPSGVKPEYAFIGSGLIPQLDILVEPPPRPLQFQDFVRQVLSARKARLE